MFGKYGEIQTTQFQCLEKLFPNLELCTELCSVDRTSSCMRNSKERVSEMKCPKCSENMEMVCEENTTVDRCTGCGGIWFDAWEAEDLIEAENGTSVDTGSKIKGMQMDRIRDINCPRCGKQMQTAADREDPLLKFEVCTDCHGYFLDAGELEDMAHVTGAEKAADSLWGQMKQFVFGFQAMHMRNLPRGK